MDIAHLSGPASKNFISQRLRLHYLDWGNQGARPLLLIHGGRDHCRNWDWVAQELRGDWHILAPDLRGHGDSAHTSDGTYVLLSYVYDLAQLIRQHGFDEVTIVGHSLGGNIALRYASLYPDKVRKLVAIEGIGMGPQEKHILATPMHDRLTNWIDRRHDLSRRMPRRYASIDEALARMMEANKHLSPDRARHLTIHGVMQNEDGTFSWKFDNYLHASAPFDLPPEDQEALLRRITCPTLLVYGAQSWAVSPADDGRIELFQDATLSVYDNAGHWAHHDQHDRFVAEIREFLR